MKKDSRDFLFSLLSSVSPSGFEQPAAHIWRDRVRDKCDELIFDVHGNSMAVLNPKADFRFMLAGHVDEIGLMITHIDEKGFIFVSQIGGMDNNLLVGQRVKIMSARGEVFGVIGRKPIHLMKAEDRKKGVEMENIWVDIGADNRKEAERMVSVGDPMVIDVQCREMGRDKVVSKATDDKAGAYVVAETIRELSKRKLNICVIGAATVQEELGLRGARTSSFRVDPHAGIATDHPETDPKKIGEVKLGGGPNLHRGANINPVMEKDILKTAKKHKIPYQITGIANATGTDANAMQLNRQGVATSLISVPNRYMHTPVEVISKKDMDNTVKLLVEFLSSHPAKKDYRP